MEQGLTLQQVARAIGVPASTYRDWEYGKAIRGEPYEKLAELFGVSLRDLLASKKTETSDMVGPLTEAKKKIDEALRIAQSLL